jgi:NifU-like protein involved in Fe-S cluster formation
MRVRACAVGQAAAAIFAREAVGRDQAELAGALSQLEDWLAHKGEVPDWPGIAPLVPARAYPARHGAILLPWKAALAGLSSPVATG